MCFLGILLELESNLESSLEYVMVLDRAVRSPFRTECVFGF